MDESDDIDDVDEGAAEPASAAEMRGFAERAGTDADDDTAATRLLRAKRARDRRAREQWVERLL